jgi:hypothetical protein
MGKQGFSAAGFVARHYFLGASIIADIGTRTKPRPAKPFAQSATRWIVTG